MASWRRLALAALPASALVVLAAPAAHGQTDSVYRWGAYKTVGWGVSASQKTPSLVPGVSGVVALAAGNSASYALTSSGQEWGWGNNGYGQLGNRTRVNSPLTPVAVDFPAGTDVVAIGEADDMAFAVDATGQGWSWGDNRRGTLCLGNRHGYDVPQRIPGMSGLVSVAAGGGVVIWLTSSGSVYTCGGTLTGQHWSPWLVTGLPAGDPAVAVSAGNAFTTVLLADGQVWDWGVGRAGQLGNGAFESSAHPVQVQLPAGRKAVQVYAGGDLGNDGHQMALLDNGEVVSWGANLCGQLGSGRSKRTAVPVAVTILGSMTVSKVAAGGTDSYVLDSAGNLWGWGNDRGGQIRQPAKRCAPLTKVDSGVDMVSATASDVLDHHP
jgi:alpha-tubulin suppressor-like RCC1 family protein